MDKGTTLPKGLRGPRPAKGRILKIKLTHFERKSPFYFAVCFDCINFAEKTYYPDKWKTISYRRVSTDQ